MVIKPRTCLTICLQVLLSLSILLASIWASLALYYQLPLAMPWRLIGIALWVGIGLFTLVHLWRRSICQGLLIYLALHAALCFVDGHLCGVAQRDFFKILISDVRVLLRHRSFRHLHISHCSSPPLT